jgi:hypothetical protein
LDVELVAAWIVPLEVGETNELPFTRITPSHVSAYCKAERCMFPAV